MTWVPRACTLPTSEQPRRAAEFDDLVGSAIRPAVRLTPTRLRLCLPGGDEVAAITRELITREASCCSFFGFTLRVTAEMSELDVRLPQGQVAVLDAVEQRAQAVRAGATATS